MTNSHAGSENHPAPTSLIHALGMNGHGYVVIPKWFVSFLSFTVSVVFVGAILWAWQVSSDVSARIRQTLQLQGLAATVYNNGVVRISLPQDFLNSLHLSSVQYALNSLNGQSTTMSNFNHQYLQHSIPLMQREFTL